MTSSCTKFCKGRGDERLLCGEAFGVSRVPEALAVFMMLSGSRPPPPTYLAFLVVLYLGLERCFF